MSTPAQRLRDRLGRSMPVEAAASWVHVAALAGHATSLGLVGPGVAPTATGRVRLTIDALAAAHPALAQLVDPAVVAAWSHDPVEEDLAAVEAHWTRAPLADGPARPDGWQLGDAWQELSVDGKSRALCQTPRFVTGLLLDLGLDPALEAHGGAVRVCDPSCGTGHLLVAAFIRCYARWRGPTSEVVERALAAVHGVDLDPYAALLASYRLLALACCAGGRTWTLRDARTLHPRVAAGDSLLDTHPLLERGQYHAVLGNPPYVTAKDKTRNDAYRGRWGPVLCHRQYSLALPFFALMTELCQPGGWVAQLTTNSFMKREFGKRFVQEYLPRFDLRWVIDTSGAYIPGHGTPTCMLVHRNQPPVGDMVAAVLGKRGEPRVPADPAKGLVWTEITRLVHSRLSAERFATALVAAGGLPPAVTGDPVALTRRAPRPVTVPRAARAGQLALFDTAVHALDAIGAREEDRAAATA